MESEEYSRSLKEGFGKAAESIEILGAWVLVVVVTGFLVWLLLNYGTGFGWRIGEMLDRLYRIAESIVTSIVLFIVATAIAMANAVTIDHKERSPERKRNPSVSVQARLRRFVGNHQVLRSLVSYMIALVTLVYGMTTGLLQLDGGWWYQNRRFRCRTPAEVEFRLIE